MVIHSKRLHLASLFFMTLFVMGFFQERVWASFSVDDEKKLGREFYERLDRANVLSKNERANAYISRLGERILFHSDQVPFDFKFSIVRSSGINAFATPGGYVYVNQGLITLVENEAQLAGVLAHEIAHVTGRHISELADKSKILNLATLAAILAGAFLGGSGDTMAAVTGFSLAASSTLSLKYSREQEEKADRAGLSFLVDTGYNGPAMLEFLKIMRRYEFYSNNIPSYFLTHPGTDERTRYIDALLQTTYTQKGAVSLIGGLKRVQTILQLGSRNTDSANLQYFQQNLKVNPQDVDDLYGLAVTQGRMGVFGDSIDTFRKALSLAPQDADILRDMGNVYYKSGRYPEASLYITQSLAINQNDPDALFFLAMTTEALGDLSKAIGFYKKLEERFPTDPDVLYHLAMAYGKSNQAGESHYYFGLYFKKKEKTDSALFHFNAAMKLFPSDTARSKEIAKEIESLKKGASPPPPHNSQK